MPNRESKVRMIEDYFIKILLNKQRMEYLISLNIPKDIQQRIKLFIENKG